MIEKKIHYVWFGNKKPEKIVKCIESWKKILVNYKIIEWNEKTFNIDEERKKNKFLNECYKRKLWAFVADYVRIKVLYEYGGIYLDTDMEVLKEFSPLLDTELFLGYESTELLSFGILGVIPKHKVFEKMLNFYEKDIWNSPYYIITNILTDTLSSLYGKNFEENQKIDIYPSKYFYPFALGEKFTPKCITEDTYAIHWWEKSWGKNPKVYFLKYKHLPFYKKYIKWGCKLINFYTKRIFIGKVRK